MNATLYAFYANRGFRFIDTFALSMRGRAFGTIQPFVFDSNRDRAELTDRERRYLRLYELSAPFGVQLVSEPEAEELILRYGSLSREP